MVVGVLRLEVFIPQSRNLKEKRSVTRSLLGRCRNRWPVSAAETGLQDLWQRAEFGIAIVTGDEGQAHTVLQNVVADIEGSGLAQVCRQDMELLQY
jgi:uncharacterized protein